MKTPKRKAGETPIEGDGGNALRRLKFYEQQRGISETPQKIKAAPEKPARRKPG